MESTKISVVASKDKFVKTTRVDKFGLLTLSIDVDTTSNNGKELLDVNVPLIEFAMYVNIGISIARREIVKAYLHFH